MSQRTERIDELLRQEIGTILSREAKDPRIGFVTITNVETTPDLRHARVWVSVIGTSAERGEALVALQHAMHFVRRELGPRLRLKRIPELHVELDDSMERGTRVLHLLDELEHGRVPDDTSELESLPTPVGRIRHEGDADEPTADEPTADEPTADEPTATGGSAPTPDASRR
jgi:ribosome-binding factor A